MSDRPAASLGWGGIARIGLVQAAIGAIVVLMTSTLNRVMVIELHLAASVPGILIGLHYVLQGLRPRWGHGADAGGRRTRWIVGGMAILSVGGTLAAVATAMLRDSFAEGMALAVVAFSLIGIGVGMAGTAALTLLADRVVAERRAAAAAMVWIMMFVGFVVASIAARVVLTPFSFTRLIELFGGTGVVAFVVVVLAVRGLDGPSIGRTPKAAVSFGDALRAVWADAPARRFAAFIFVAMLAYSAQDLILEPFVGIVFGLAPAQTAAITALQHGGTLAGMVAVALLGRRLAGTAAMRRVTIVGCTGAALALVVVAMAGLAAVAPLIRPAVAALGFANGVFAIAAVGLMMTLAGKGEDAGVRMGVWGAAQAIAFGGGGFVGAAAADLARLALGAAVPGYALVFVIEAGLFVAAAAMMMRRERVAAPMLMTAE